MELKGSKTEANLMTAFSGESQARNKYTYYARARRAREGYVQIAEIFEETANNEKEHAKIWFKLLRRRDAHTAANLLDAANGENSRWTDMGRHASPRGQGGALRRLPPSLKWSATSKGARGAVQSCFQSRGGTVFVSDDVAIWQCGNCGHIVVGKKAPEICPVCEHPKAYFRIKAENY